MIIFIFILVSLAGVFAHWLKKWCRDEVQGGFIHWLISEPKHTLYTFMTLGGALYTLYSTGALIDINRETIALVFLTGFSADSTFNKAEGVNDG